MVFIEPKVEFIAINHADTVFTSGGPSQSSCYTGSPQEDYVVTCETMQKMVMYGGDTGDDW